MTFVKEFYRDVFQKLNLNVQLYIKMYVENVGNFKRLFKRRPIK